MANSEVNVEFGKCSFDIDEDEEALSEEDKVLGISDESIQTGCLYFDKHRKDSKHTPFLLTPYSIEMHDLFSKVFEIWKIPFPRIIFTVISEVEGSPSDTYRKVSRKLVRGLVHALHTTEMWICTDGLDYGFSRDVGKGFSRENSRRKTLGSNMKNIYSASPETAVIGICRKDDLSFSKKLDNENGVGGKKEINNCYDYFIFLEDSTEGRRGESQFFLNFANYISKSGSTIRVDEKSEKTSEIPVINLLLHGTLTQIDLILEQLKYKLPLIVFDGSGGLADLIAFAYKQASLRPEGINVAEYTESVLKPQLCDKMHEVFPEQSDFNISILSEKIFNCIGYSTQLGREFVTVLNIGCVEFASASLPRYFLEALFKSKISESIKNARQMKKDLFFAMDWNCADVARREFFARDTSHTFEIDDGTFFRALTTPHREEFVSLFINEGFVLHTYLDSSNLLDLFQHSLNREFFRTVVWETVLGFGSNVEVSRTFLDSKLIILIEELTGIPSLINSYELDWNGREIYDDRTPQEAERKANAVLALWAILSYRVQLAKAIWKHSEQPIHLALACSIILKKLEAFVTDLSLKNEMEKQSHEFSMMAVNVMSVCYEDVPCRALDLLNEKNRVWSYKALMELAAFSKNKMFIAHPCCQKYLDNIFMGHIKVRDLPYGDITIPLWLKITLSAFLIFPIYFWVRFEAPVESKTPDKKSPSESPSSPERDSNSREKEESAANQQQSYDPGVFWKLYFFWSAPITKFWVCQVFYVLFLVCFSLAVIWPACGNVFLDFFTCVWIATFIIDSIYHAYSLNLKYTSMPWVSKCLEIAVMVIFLFGFAMGRIIWKNTFMTPYQAKVMLCIGLLYFYYRLIFVSLPISSELGPMLYRVKRMIVVDFVSYIRVTILVIISNGIVIHAVIYPDYPLGWELFRRAFYDAMISFFLTPSDHFGVPNPKCVRLNRGSIRVPLVGLSECKVGRYLKYSCPNPGVWPYLFGIQYLIILRLILVVLLFAIFSNTQKKLEEEGKYIWKYQRYELVINFSNRLTLPPPLSVITLVYMLLRYIFDCSCDYANRYVFQYSKLKGYFRRDSEPCTQDRLGENDYRYWKNSAVLHYRQARVEEDAEVIKKKRLVHINSLTNALNKQRTTLSDLEGHLTELQFQIKNAHQYLEGTDGVLVSMRERLHARHVPQIFSRISPYPNTRISRYPVSDNHVPWKINWTMYNPISYTAPQDELLRALRPYTDVDIQKKREVERESFRMPKFNWNKVIVNPGGVLFNRKSWISDKLKGEFEFELDSEDLPRNPQGRTGMKGRGTLLRWGPNHFIFVVITRWHGTGEQLLQQYLDVILMTDEEGRFSLPGGYVHIENRYGVIQSLFDIQQTWFGPEDMKQFFESGYKEKIAEEPPETEGPSDADASEEASPPKAFKAERVKLGYMDEETNTDQAWCEAEIWHFHYNYRSRVDESFKARVEWHLLSEENLMKVPIGQASVIHSVAKDMKAVSEII